MSGAVAPLRNDAAPLALAAIQAPVRARLDRVMPEMHNVVSHELPMIGQVAGHLLGTRGKLFRPTLALLASDVEGQSDDRVLKLAAAIELMHMATLVHDDSVDHSSLRRGLPTVNALFSHQISVIMGDFLYSRALNAMTRLENLDVLKILTNVSSELAIGEMRQLAAINALEFGETEYVKLIRSKTGSLLSAACETGTFYGGASVRHRVAMARYGELLGLAFQIADDLLDYTEDEATTGKPTGLDLKEHKVTLPLICALPHMRQSARARVDALFADDEPSDELVAEVVAIVGEAGGLELARERGGQFAQEAHDCLARLPESPVRAALANAILYVMERRS